LTYIGAAMRIGPLKNSELTKAEMKFRRTVEQLLFENMRKYVLVILHMECIAEFIQQER
jgi:hypothetical protein